MFSGASLLTGDAEGLRNASAAQLWEGSSHHLVPIAAHACFFPAVDKLLSDI